MKARGLVPGSGEPLKHTLLLGGVSSSHATGMGILGVEYQKVQWGGAGRGFLSHS